ncbi:ATP-dependent RNA helicase [Dentipellis sp. KUC8613]|nr:ATP-dependent RNA helicase [Dentipellis sp. KUC8613]
MVTYDEALLPTRSPIPEVHNACAPSFSIPLDPQRSPFFAEVEEKLTRVFGLRDFRTNQLAAIIATLSGQDVLVLMPTGGGKSLCYQVPALCRGKKKRGVTFVVSPLIALMHDQVQQLQLKHVDAQLFTGEQDTSDREMLSSRLLGTGEKPTIVYITPEKLHSSSQMTRILQFLYSRGELARFVIDEAHLISSWGRDFRESYVSLRDLRRDYADVPIMALTATATREQQRDIITGLGLRDYLLLTQSFNRSNLHYAIQKKPPRTVDFVHKWIMDKHPQETGIIYCGGRDKCEKVAKQLRDLGLTAKHFHAEIDPQDKMRTMEDWKSGRCKIIVATIAFGMGIDKADVRFVIHHDMPSSLAGYNQETGRAGRDGKPSDCLLLYAFGDYTWQLDRIRKDEGLSEENKLRQSRDLDDMNHFCTNTIDCRRTQLLSIFHETFDPSACHGTCDNCTTPGHMVEEDVTTIASHLVEMFESAQALGIKITKPMGVDVYRGSRKKDLLNKHFDRLTHFGVGKTCDRARVERTLQRLLDDRILNPTVGPSGSSGYSATYIEVGFCCI